MNVNNVGGYGTSLLPEIFAGYVRYRNLKARQEERPEMTPEEIQNLYEACQKTGESAIRSFRKNPRCDPGLIAEKGDFEHLASV